MGSILESLNYPIYLLVPLNDPLILGVTTHQALGLRVDHGVIHRHGQHADHNLLERTPYTLNPKPSDPNSKLLERTRYTVNPKPSDPTLNAKTEP